MSPRILIMAMLAAGVAFTVSGCSVWPEPIHEPRVQNPYPQLHKVAVAPFFNLSTEPTLDGRACALAYYSELQSVPGYEVVPIGVVEQTLRSYGLSLNRGADVRDLARILEVDAVVIGAVSDFDAFYPPRYTLTVEWYAADPTLLEIPAGYGLPLGTPAQKLIPDRLRYEAELAQARAQLQPHVLSPGGEVDQTEIPEGLLPTPPAPVNVDDQSPGTMTGIASMPASAVQVMPNASTQTLTPSAPDASAPTAFSDQPVMRHTATFNGNDPAVIESLKRDRRVDEDQRRDGWEGHMQRSDDFIRFCSRMHIQEMLAARGGAQQTRVTWRWPERR